MDDLISRAAAIEGLLGLCPEKTEPGSFDEYGVTVLCGAVELVLKSLPTIPAISVEWLKGLMLSTEDDVDKVEFAWIMREWESEQKEQEAR